VCFWRGNTAAKNKGKGAGIWILMGGIFLPKRLHLFPLLVVQQFIYHEAEVTIYIQLSNIHTEPNNQGTQAIDEGSLHIKL
jgi:hypothetical protein